MYSTGACTRNAHDKAHSAFIYIKHSFKLHIFDINTGGGFAAFGGGGGGGSFAAAAQKGGTFGGIAASGPTPGRPQAPVPAGDMWAPRR